MEDVTRILNALDQGDARNVDQLLPLVYDHLRQLAARQLAQERANQTLQPTALVHEAYLRLVQASAPRSWESRGQFFAAAAEAMRRILIDHARHRGRLKRGGGCERIELDVAEVADSAVCDGDLLALDEALAAFAAEDPKKAQLVKLRFFAGLSIEDAADCLGISRATATRHLAYARAWLYDRMHGEPK